MIKKIVFCLILLCCMSSVAFAENPSDNVNEISTNNTINIDDWPIPIINPVNFEPITDPDINNWFITPIDNMTNITYYQDTTQVVFMGSD